MKDISILERQNDPQAISLLKASESCLRTERILKYLMIFLSFGICLAAIFNRYLPSMIPNSEATQELAATYMNLISGAIIVAGIPIGFYMSRKHTEGTVLRDRYEAYIFDNQPNKSILRPISNAYITNYAKKIRKTDDKFYNYILTEEDNLNDWSAQFDFIVKEIHSDYNLYLWVQPKFIAIWIGFCIFILVIALSFDDKFINTLINILIPSLSAISTICSSWFSLRLQMRQLNNLINVTDQIQAMSPDKKKQYLGNKENIRLLADGLYNYRSSSFIIPTPLIMLYQWSVSRSKNKNNPEEGAEPAIAAYRQSAAAKKKSAEKAKAAKAVKPTATKEVAAAKAPTAKPATANKEVKPEAKPAAKETKAEAKTAAKEAKPAEAKTQSKEAKPTDKAKDGGKPQTENKPKAAPKDKDAKPQTKDAKPTSKK